MTLTEFLLARIAEDEAVWGAGPVATPPTHDLGAPSAGEFPDGSSAVMLSANRMAAECWAKRRIVERHTLEPDEVDEFCATCGTFHDYPVAWPCADVRALAAIYADHEDYQREWRP